MGLSKEGMEGVRAVREKIKGKYFSDKLQVWMGEGTVPTRKIGEEWTDEDGKTWVQKNGYYMNKTKLHGAKVPLFCPKCNGNMGDHEKKFHTGCWSRFGHCYSCQLKFEGKLKREGKWEDFVKRMKVDFNLHRMYDAKKEFDSYKESMLKPVEFENYDKYGHKLNSDTWWASMTPKQLDDMEKEMDETIKELEEEYEKLNNKIDN